MKRFLLLLFFIISLFPLRASNENVVIENCREVYRVIPAKDGKSVKEIKNSVTIDFRARRTAGKAYAEAFYNDRITIDKASGGETEYGMTEDDDVFFPTRKSAASLCLLKKPATRRPPASSARSKTRNTFPARRLPSPTT